MKTTNNKKYLFAWSTYDNGLPYYTAVADDFTLFISDNWEAFYAHTRCYCEYAKKIFCNGFLTANEDVELFTHKSFVPVFYIAGNKLVKVTEEQITYYDKERDTEAEYFGAVATWNERNAN